MVRYSGIFQLRILANANGLVLYYPNKSQYSILPNKIILDTKKCELVSVTFQPKCVSFSVKCVH